MKLLYKAYACEDLKGNGIGKVLLPGCLGRLNVHIHPGDRLRLEFSDGTWITTTAIGSETVHVDEGMAGRLGMAASGFYCAARVTGTFSSRMLEQGALVYLIL